MPQIDRLLTFIHERKDLNAKFQFVGIVNQEAHAKDVWPIGYGDLTLNATTDVKSRIDNAKILLQRFKPLQRMLPHWYVDIPTDSLFHVGGSFNDYYDVWPHKYLVFSPQGVLLFRSHFHRSKEIHYVKLDDLIVFLASLSSLF